MVGPEIRRVSCLSAYNAAACAPFLEDSVPTDASNCCVFLQMVVEHLWTLHGCEPHPPSQEEVLLEDQRVVSHSTEPLLCIRRSRALTELSNLSAVAGGGAG